MKRSIKELAIGSENICYINTCVLHSNRNFDWLKPYVLLYDNILLDQREAFDFQAIEITNSSEIWPWLKKNALFLEDFEEMDKDSFITPQSNPLYLPAIATRTILTKSGYLNKTFLAGFQKRMHFRNQGATDYTRAFEVWKTLMFEIKPNLNNLNMVGGANTLCLWPDLFAASMSFQLSMTGRIPSVLDSLSSWLVGLIFNSFGSEEIILPRFKKILLRHVPDFKCIPWATIIELRNSRFRKLCLNKLQNLTADNSEILKNFENSLWKLAAEARRVTDIRTTILKGIGSNIPIPVVNPVGIGLAITDAFQSIKIQKKFGWVFFVEEIRNAQNFRKDRLH